jgi:hypothetical protein
VLMQGGMDGRQTAVPPPVQAESRVAAQSNPKTDTTLTCSFLASDLARSTVSRDGTAACELYNETSNPGSLGSGARGTDFRSHQRTATLRVQRRE